MGTATSLQTPIGEVENVEEIQGCTVCGEEFDHKERICMISAVRFYEGTGPDGRPFIAAKESMAESGQPHRELYAHIACLKGTLADD